MEKIYITKRQKESIISELETVISCLKFKKKYLREGLPRSLTKDNVIDEDINCLEKEILPKIKRL